MRISDWSSDVCSSDLIGAAFAFSAASRSLISFVVIGFLPGPTKSTGRPSPFDITHLPIAPSAHHPRSNRRRVRNPCPRRRRRSAHPRRGRCRQPRSEEHTSELQSLMRTSYAVFCLKKKNLLQTTQYLENNIVKLMNE